MAVDVVLPSLGDGVTHGTLIRWLKEPGDRVELDEPLFEVSTDKVDAEVPAPTSGVLIEIVRHMGDEVRVGDRVARIGTSEEWSTLAPPRFGRTARPGDSLLSATLHGPIDPLDDSRDAPLGLAQPRLGPPGSSPVAVISEDARDESIVEAAVDELGRLGLGHERHRLEMHQPATVREYVNSALARGVRMAIVCGGAGGHLAAMVAAESGMPVIAVPRADRDGAHHTPQGLALVVVSPGEDGARQAVLFLTRIASAFAPAIPAPLPGGLDDSMEDGLF